MNVIERAKSIILKPAQTWGEIKDDKITISELYLSYIMILAAIPAFAQFIGNAFIGYSVMGMHYRMGFFNALGYSIASYLMSLFGVYIVAIIANALAPQFDSEQNLTNALKAVAFSMTPSWIAGILYIIPPFSMLVFIAGLYGIYLFYLGLPLLMNTPRNKSLVYVIVVIVVTIVVYILFGFIVSAIFMSGPMVIGMMG